MNTENINIEDIKVGEMYNVRVKVSRINAAGVFCYACDKDGTYLGKHTNLFTEDEVEAFFPITPENGTKNTASAPKYDPCRMFRKGDKVRVVKCNGRSPAMPFSDYKEGDICIVMKDEDETSYFVRVESDDKCGRDFLFCCLELVAPVEELEPYKCGVGIDAQLIFINDELFAEFENEEDAKRVCALLNAEHRKEQNNA